jgi:hypothetical protein
MTPEMIVTILRLILCNPQMLEWLEAEAQKTDTPVDDTILAILKLALCKNQ